LFIQHKDTIFLKKIIEFLGISFFFRIFAVRSCEICNLSKEHFWHVTTASSKTKTSTQNDYTIRLWHIGGSFFEVFFSFWLVPFATHCKTDKKTMQ